MAVYNEKDCENTCKCKNAHFYTWIMAIRLSYFQSGYWLTNILNVRSMYKRYLDRSFEIYRKLETVPKNS